MRLKKEIEKFLLQLKREKAESHIIFSLNSLTSDTYVIMEYIDSTPR